MTALIVVLFLVVAMTNIGPELVAWATGGSVGAWEYVADGSETAVLWLSVLVAMWPNLPRESMRTAALAVCFYGAMEKALNPICRLAFAMNQPPPPAPKGLCTAAGWPWWWHFTPVALALCAVAVARIHEGS